MSGADAGAVPDGAPVVFDLDGTLVRSEHVHRRIWARFFAEWGAEVDDDTYRHRFMAAARSTYCARSTGRGAARTPTSSPRSWPGTAPPSPTASTSSPAHPRCSARWPSAGTGSRW